MESCPHCNFLVRDGARTCGVCHRPLTDDAPSQLAGAGDARVAPSGGGTSVAVVALMLLLLLFGTGAGLAAMAWP